MGFSYNIFFFLKYIISITIITAVIAMTQGYA